MNWTTWIGLGAVSGGLSVIFGAFGSHYLAEKLDSHYLGVFEIGARYQMYHAFALMAVGFFSTRVTTQQLNLSGYLFLAGTIVFSGSLYLLATTGTKWLGAVTPIGGALLIGGWALLAYTAFTVG